MCFIEKGKEKNLNSEYFYIVSALHIDEEQLKGSSIDELIKNIYSQLKPFLPCIEQDLVLLEEYLMLSIKQQAIWGAYMRARKQMTDTYLGTREIVFLGERGFEETNKYIQNTKKDIENGQKIEGVYLGEIKYGHDMFYNEEPLPGTKYVKQSKRKREIAISAFRNKLGELKRLDCYSRVFLGVNPEEKHYCFPVYNAELINVLLSPLNAFEKKLSELGKIIKFDMSEKNQNRVIACYKAHQKLASFFKIPKINSSSAAIRDALAFNHELEAFYHVEYLQKAMEYRKRNRMVNYVYETMLENTLIANAELPNSFFRDVIIRKEIEFYKMRFFRKKNKGTKNQLVTFFEEEDIQMSEFESILHWAKRTTELPRIMNKLIYPTAEILLCNSLATDGGYEDAFTTLKRYLSDNRIFLGRGIESYFSSKKEFLTKNQTTDRDKIKQLEKKLVEMFFAQSLDTRCHEEKYRNDFLLYIEDIRKAGFLEQYVQMLYDAKEEEKKVAVIKSSELSESDFVFLYHFYRSLFTVEKSRERKRSSVSSNIRNAGSKNAIVSGQTNNVQEHYRNILADAMKELILAP